MTEYQEASQGTDLPIEFETTDELVEQLPDHLAHRNVALIGPPSIGKTRAVLRQINAVSDTVLVHSTYDQAAVQDMAKKEYVSENRLISLADTERLEALSDDSEPPYIVFDDIYTILEESLQRATNGSSTHLDILSDLLNADNGVCLVTTPYRWNYLNGAVQAEESASILSRLKQAILSRNDDDSDRSVSRQGPYADILEEWFNTSSDPVLCVLKYETNGSAAAALQRVPEEERYFDIEGDLNFPVQEFEMFWPINGRIDYKTHIPFVYLCFSSQSTDEFLEAADRFEQENRLSSNLSLTAIGQRFQEGLTDQTADEIATELTRDLGFVASFAVDSSVSGGIGTMLYLAKIAVSDDVSPAKQLGEMAGSLVRLTPPEREEIERETGLEPLALTAFRDLLTNPFNQQELSRIVTTHEDEIKRIESMVEVPIDQIAGFDEDQLEDLNTTFEQSITFTDICDIVLSNRIQSPRATLHAELKKEVGDIVDGVTDWTVIPTEQVTKICKEIHEQNTEVILVEGPSGAGKTATAYAVAERLDDWGYFVAVPEINSSATAALLKKIDEPTVLIHEFSYTESTPIESLSTLLEWLDRSENIYNTLVVTISPEVRDRLEISKLKREKRYLWSNYWESLEPFVITGVSPRTATNILTANFNDRLDYTERPQIFDFATVTNTSGKTDKINPLFCIAAQEYIRKNTDSDESPGDLLKHYTPGQLLYDMTVGSLFERVGGALKYPNQAWALRYLAAAEKLSPEEIGSFPEITSDDIDALLASLDCVHKTYFGRFYSIRPELLQLLIFEKECFRQSVFEDLLDAFSEPAQRVTFTRMIGAGLQRTAVQPYLDEAAYREALNQILSVADSDELYAWYLNAATETWYSFQHGGAYPLEEDWETVRGTDVSLPPEAIDIDRLINGLPSRQLFTMLATLCAPYASQGKFDIVERYRQMAVKAASEHSYDVEPPTDPRIHGTKDWEEVRGVEDAWLVRYDSDRDEYYDIEEREWFAPEDRPRKNLFELPRREQFLLDFHKNMFLYFALGDGPKIAHKRFPDIERLVQKTAAEEVGSETRRIRFTKGFYQALYRADLLEEVIGPFSLLQAFSFIEDTFSEALKESGWINPSHGPSIPRPPILEGGAIDDMLFEQYEHSWELFFDICSELTERYLDPDREFYQRTFEREFYAAITRRLIELYVDAPDVRETWFELYAPWNAFTPDDIAKIDYYLLCMSYVADAWLGPLNGSSTVEEVWHEVFDGIENSAISRFSERGGSDLEIKLRPILEFYSGLISEHLEGHSLQEVEGWIAKVEDSVRTSSAKNIIHYDIFALEQYTLSQLELIIRFYAETAAEIAVDAGFADGQEWVEYLETRLITFLHADETINGMSLDDVTHSRLYFYSIFFIEMAHRTNQNPTIIHKWINWIESRVDEHYMRIDSGDIDRFLGHESSVSHGYYVTLVKGLILNLRSSHWHAWVLQNRQDYLFTAFEEIGSKENKSAFLERIILSITHPISSKYCDKRIRKIVYESLCVWLVKFEEQAPQVLEKTFTELYDLAVLPIEELYSLEKKIR